MPLKRPSSARRYVTQECFSSFVSSSRLHNVQSLVGKPNDVEDHRPDAMLCIMGIDSRYNDGCRELINYLLFGFFDVRKSEIESSGYDEETIDDIVFLIKNDSVHVYCNPINYHYLLPYIGSWQNLQIHCMTENEFEDDEAAENFKIKSFIEMNENCLKIGIPYSTHGHQQKFDPFTIEKWPLVQAHGLDEFGAGGFFTMKYEVVDMSSVMTRIYSLIDPVSLEEVVTENLPLFERQCQSIITYIDIVFKEDSTLENITESNVFEPIQSYFSHGRVSSSSIDDTKQPYLMFGSHSTKACLKDAEQGIASISDMDLKSSGPAGKPAKHMVFQAVCPRTSLCCARTYFFNSGHCPYPMSGASPKAPSPPKSDIELLNRLYMIVIDAVLYAINIYGQTASVKQCKQSCLKNMMENAVENKLDHFPFLSSNNHVDVGIIASDKFGNIVNLEEGCSISYAKTISLCIYDIPSLEYPGQLLGSVVFAESFLDSSLQVLNTDNSKDVSSECLVLTSAVPRTVLWAANKGNEELIKERDSYLLHSSDTYGKLLLNGESVQVLGSPQNDAPSEGQLYIYQKAIVLQHCRHGLVVFPKSYFEELQLYDGDSFNKVAVLVMVYRHSLQPFLPLQYHTPGDQVMFIFQPKTRVYKTFYSEVLSAWQNAGDGPQLKQLDKPPPIYADKYRYLEMLNSNTGRVKSGKFAVAKAKLPELNRFLDHLAASSSNQATVPSANLAAVINEVEQEPPKVIQTDVVITIVCGVVGSHKENLCKALTSMAKEQNRWVTLKAPFESSDEFDAKELQASLSNTVAAAKKRGIRASIGGRKRLRILYIPPGFVDLPKAVHAIEQHPDPAIAGQLSIGAVTTCIDPLNMFITNRLTMPKLLNQCAEGWVNNVLFTSSTEPKDPNLATAQQLIRAVNTNVAFIIANHGDLTRSPDAELILSETAFQEASAIRARHHNPDRCIIPSSLSVPSMGEVALHFSQPLDKPKLVSKLRCLKANLAPHPFTGNIYAVRAKVAFTDSEKQMEVHYVTLSGHMSMVAVSDAPVIRPPTTAKNGSSTMSNGDCNREDSKVLNCVVFTGCGLEKQQLQDWLRSCARQKPEKKTLRSRTGLTKQELKNIHTKHHLDPLPEGWFYNGSQYVSMAGERNTVHPDMENFVEEYIMEANKVIEAYNNKIDQEDFKDLFA